tara:strand:+ start:322 stop:1245 length:924 start_codon:yes stop_codon:yes gene_type:complete
MNQSLTRFGENLAKAVKNRQKFFDSSVEKCIQSYAQNLKLIDQLKVLLASKTSVLILGAGPLNTNLSFNQLSSSFIISGVQWTDFNDNLDLDILLSTHVSPLQASFYKSNYSNQTIIIHGVYSKTPPVLNNSITIRWSDPLMDPQWVKKPTLQALHKIVELKSYGPAPYIPAVRNVIFLNAMTMIWLGAKEITFTAIDPYNPIYFFHGNKEKSLEIIQAVSSIDPYIAIWDGRNERIDRINRDTDHRIQEIISDLSRQKSAVGDKKRIDVMRKGMIILKKYAEFRGVSLNYLGESKFMDEMGLSRVD